MEELKFSNITTCKIKNVNFNSSRIKIKPCQKKGKRISLKMEKSQKLQLINFVRDGKKCIEISQVKQNRQKYQKYKEKEKNKQKEKQKQKQKNKQNNKQNQNIQKFFAVKLPHLVTQNSCRQRKSPSYNSPTYSNITQPVTQRNTVSKTNTTINIDNIHQTSPTPSPKTSRAKIKSIVKQKYIFRLSKIIEQGNNIQRQGQKVKSKAKLLQQMLSKKYHQMSLSTNSIITGIVGYHLEEQKNRGYRNDVRNMWMRTDK